MLEQMEFVKGSIVAANDIRTHLERYLENLQSKKAELRANEAASKRNKQARRFVQFFPPLNLSIFI